MEITQAAVQADPSYYEAQYNLGLSALQAGNLTHALVAYETALAIHPGSLEARYNFARVLQMANYPYDAVDQFKTLIAVYPDEARAHFALATIYDQQLRLPRSAREHYLRILQIQPGHPQTAAIRRWLAANSG